MGISVVIRFVIIAALEKALKQKKKEMKTKPVIVFDVFHILGFVADCYFD